MLYNMLQQNRLDQENIVIRQKYELNRINALKNRSLKIREQERKDQLKIASTVPILDKKALFWLGLGLYWAEGAKTERWRAVFYNSDEAINKAMMQFFRSVCGVEDSDIHIQLVLHQNIKEDMAKQYWSNQLDIPLHQFYKASYVKSRASKGIRPPTRLPYGTVQISVSGKSIANRIKGLLMGLEDNFLPRV